MKIHNSDKFYQHSICGFQVKSFQIFTHQFSFHEMALFGRFFGPYSPKQSSILPKFSPDYYSSKQKCCLKTFEGFEFLQKRDEPKDYTFGPTFTFRFPLKMAKIEENKQTLPLSTKSTITFCTIGVFFSRKQGGFTNQSARITIYYNYFIHTISGQLPVKKIRFYRFPVLRLQITKDISEKL